MTLTLRRLALILGLAQCTFCAGVSAQGLGSGNGTATPSAHDAAEEAQYGPIERIGGSVSQPVLIHSAEPKFSKEASEAKPFMASILVGLIVDRNGLPQDLHIVRGVGMGLDENAIAAVRKYRFKPARKNGAPVAVRLNVEVNFTKQQ